LRVPLLTALAAALLYLFAAASRDFWAPDEPDFAEHVREMIERRDLLVPYQNGVPYSEKPIFFYWAIAATTPLSGGDVQPLATRLPSVLGCAFLVFGASYLAGRAGSEREALVAGAATAVAPIVFWQGQFLQVDALFSGFLMLGFVALFFLEGESGNSTRWRWALRVALVLAVLTKGPLAVALAGLVVLTRCALRGSWAPLLVLHPFRSILVGLVLVVPWYIAAAQAGGPAYAYDLIVNQNWNRFFRAFDHIQPWWFYFESVWGDFFPWTFLALASPFVLRRLGLFERRPELGFSATVFTVCFVFLSLSGSKQGKYLLAAYPFAAVLLAAAAGALETARDAGASHLRRFFRSFVLLVAGLILGASVALAPSLARRAPEFAFLAPYLALPLGLGAAGTIAILLRRPKEILAGLLALAATLAAGEAATAAAVFPALDVLKTGRPLYDRIRPLVSHGEPLAYFGEPYRCYAILVLRRRTEHFSKEADLEAWLLRTPNGRVLVDASEKGRWKRDALRGLVVFDRQRVGGDEAFFLGRP
jgi:4-amino-4-deoxy-L-arabinose transferase-like glycosyltransferase